MPKVDFSFIVYNGMPFIDLNLQNIYPFANKIIIVEGPVKHYVKLGFTSSTDGTLEAIKNFPDPQKKIVLVSGQWNEKDEMVKAQEEHFAGDYLWCPDADEFWKSEDIQKIFDILDTGKYYSVGFRLNSFYGGFERYIGGWEQKFETQRIQRIVPGKSKFKTHRPPTMYWPQTGKTCREMGHLGFEETSKMGIFIYHYSHVLPSQVKAKMVYYFSRDNRGIIANYWNKIYVPWMKAQTDADRRAVEQIYIGVQENAPNVRGEAYTEKFNERHPEIIENNMDKLLEVVEMEKKELIGGGK